MEENKQPGIMMYFDMYDIFLAFSFEQIGLLIMAMLLFAKTGEEMDLPSELQLAFQFAKQRVIKDAKRYREKCKQTSYASFCAQLVRLGLPKIDKDVWLVLTDDERDRMLSGGTVRNANTTTETITDTNTTSSTTTTSNTTTVSDTWLIMAPTKFGELVAAYPAHRRNNIRRAFEAYCQNITSAEMHDLAMKNLTTWTRHAQWAENDGR